MGPWSRVSIERVTARQMGLMFGSSVSVNVAVVWVLQQSAVACVLGRGPRGPRETSCDSSGPALWFCSSRPVVEFLPTVEHTSLFAVVALMGCDMAGTAAAMLAIVPGNEAGDPSLGCANIGKSADARKPACARACGSTESFLEWAHPGAERHRTLPSHSLELEFELGSA
jgi:hypothetical protein